MCPIVVWYFGCRYAAQLGAVALSNRGAVAPSDMGAVALSDREARLKDCNKSKKGGNVAATICSNPSVAA